MAFAPIPATYSNSKEGNMRMLAVTSAKRSTLAPEIPTIAEQGVPGFEAVLRYGVVAPAGTPAPIIARLNKALNEALTSDEIRKRLALEGAEPLPSPCRTWTRAVASPSRRYASRIRMKISAATSRNSGDS